MEDFEVEESKTCIVGFASDGCLRIADMGADQVLPALGISGGGEVEMTLKEQGWNPGAVRGIRACFNMCSTWALSSVLQSVDHHHCWGQPGVPSPPAVMYSMSPRI